MLDPEQPSPYPRRAHAVPLLASEAFEQHGNVAGERRVVITGCSDRPRKRHKSRKVFRTRAQRIGFEHALYDVPSSGLWLPPGSVDPQSVDPFINGYESEAGSVLDQLDAGKRIDLEPWLRTAVPFVASMFVRGVDFADRFESRPAVQAGRQFVIDASDGTNRARILELNLLLSLVVGARWVVLHQTSNEPFITTSLGLMPTVDLGRKQFGFAIPIGTSSTLGIFPQSHRTVAAYRAGGWQALVEHRFLNAAEVGGFNRQLAQSATEWIVGAHQRLVETYLLFMGDTPPDPRTIMDRWPFDHQTRVAHAQEWHRLVSATAENPSPEELPNLQQIDWGPLRRGWCPPITITLNMIDIPTGLRRVGNTIMLSLAKPEKYDQYFVGTDTERDSWGGLD